MTNLSDQYKPPTLLRSPHLQNVLASCGVRRLIYKSRVQLNHRASESVVLDCGQGVRLQGFYDASRTADPAKGLVIIFHGWLGSAKSDYVVAMAWHLAGQGYSVFRLNFRDHGNTHHLNEGHFNSTHLDEVEGAIRAIQARFPAVRTFLAGFSLGGNFALRLALRQNYQQPLSRVFAVSPVICPANCFECLSRSALLYERYFVVKWRRLLLAKSRAFPQYDYYNERLKQFKHLSEMNRYFIPRLTEFDGVESYMNAYSLAGNTLAELQVKSTALFADDDPVVPCGDLNELACPRSLEIVTAACGGHCAFLNSWTLNSFANQLAVEVFERELGPKQAKAEGFGSPPKTEACQNQWN